MVSYNKITDEQLIILLRNDDREAFAEIYERYAKILAGFAGSKLYDLDDAADILHDIFVNLWESRHKINISSNLKSYLFAGIRHRVIDKIRKNITRREYAVLLQSLVVFDEESIEEQIEAKELQQILQNSITHLSPRVKEIYKLSREEGLSNREIAERLNLSEQTVKNQITMALNQMRKSLASFTLLFLWLLS